MDSSLLRLLFARALRASLASPLVLAGCGGEGGNQVGHPITAAEGYAAPACADNALAVSGLSPTVPVDYVALRGFVAPQSGTPSSGWVASSSGTACATASNPATCESTLRNLTSRSGFHFDCLQLCTAYYLATTRGDEVAAHGSLEALKQWLGSLDTTQEAALLAFAQGYNLACDNLERGAVRAHSDGSYNVVATKGYACGAGTAITRFVLSVSPSGELKELSSEVVEQGSPNCAIGRRPVGLREAGGVACADALGRHFASAAHLEAASINAFLRLHEELVLHGADEALQGEALVSALEEVLHTHATAQLARRFGATPRRPEVEVLPLRPLFEVALDNAVEGCVRETYGALVAHHQAQHARDEQVRALMARIAEDETRHAGLSWAVGAWAHAQLSAAEREALREAQRKAVATLREEVATPLDAALVQEAGMPAPEVASSLVASLEQELWA